MMRRTGLLAVLLFSITSTIAIAQQEGDPHLSEPGTAVLVSRSGFAHGYRHGYEAGYHLGNIDANMARPPKTKIVAPKGISSGYQPIFGPKHSFEDGFHSGLKAGYSDGYAGRNFRAISEFRSLGASLSAQPQPGSENKYFDNGVRAGYTQGLDHSPTVPSALDLDFRLVTCPESDSSGFPAAAQRIYCDGYQRGYILGRADGAILPAEHGLLEASR